MARMTRAQPGARQRHEPDGEQDAGNRHEPVHDPHHDVVEPAQVAGEHADHEPRERADQRDGHADDQRHARAVDDAAVDVAPQAVGAHPVLDGRSACRRRCARCARRRGDDCARRDRSAPDRRCRGAVPERGAPRRQDRAAQHDAAVPPQATARARRAGTASPNTAAGADSATAFNTGSSDRGTCT